MVVKTVAKIVGILILGALGAWLFEYFIFPFTISDRNVVVNQTQQIYITENTALENAIKNVQKSIVAIQKNGVFAGSGLIATSDGSVITLASLIPAGSRTVVLLNGEPVNFKIEKRDLKDNLALIKIEKNNLATVGFADANKIMLGQRVFLIGSDFANEGIIRSFNNNIVKTNISEKFIASGTPLFNISGELVGLNFVDSDAKVSAISINTIKSFLGI